MEHVEGKRRAENATHFAAIFLYQYFRAVSGRVGRHVGHQVDAIECPFSVSREPLDVKLIKLDCLVRAQFLRLRQQQRTLLQHAVDLLNFGDLVKRDI